LSSPMAEHDRVEDITPVMARKLGAIRCHRSQVEMVRYDLAIRGLNRYRGLMTSRCDYAEVFGGIGSQSGAPDPASLGTPAGRVSRQLSGVSRQLSGFGRRSMIRDGAREFAGAGPNLVPASANGIGSQSRSRLGV